MLSLQKPQTQRRQQPNRSFPVDREEYVLMDSVCAVVDLVKVGTSIEVSLPPVISLGWLCGRPAGSLPKRVTFIPGHCMNMSVVLNRL